jgi:hypothetical protein
VEQLRIDQKKAQEDQKKAQEDQKKAQEDQKKAQEEMLGMLRDQQTVSAPMSKANKEFSEELLGALGIRWQQLKRNTDAGQNYEFDWTGGEDKNTPVAMEKLEALMDLPDIDGESIQFFNARKFDLFPLHATGKRCTGQSDVGIEVQDTAYEDNRFIHTLQLTELKTEASKIRVYQLLLQLASLSRMSRFRQGVVIMGTDCVAGWTLAHFERRNCIHVQNFSSGSACLARLHTLLASIISRSDALAPLPSIVEGATGSSRASSAVVATPEQDVSGFDDPVSPGMDAIDRELLLQRVARAMNDYTGGAANVSVPSWATAASGEYSTPSRSLSYFS